MLIKILLVLSSILSTSFTTTHLTDNKINFDSFLARNSESVTRDSPQLDPLGTFLPESLSDLYPGKKSQIIQDRLIITYTNSANPDARKKLLSTFRTTSREFIDFGSSQKIEIVDFPDSTETYRAMGALQHSNLVESVVFDQVFQIALMPNETQPPPNDPDYALTWGMEQMNVLQAWETTKGSRDIVVGVIDTGIDLDHPDLIDNLWVNTDEIANNGVDDDNNGFIDDVHGWDFVNNDNVPNDDVTADHWASGHGTHVAGTIAGVGNNGIGVVGVAWYAKLMALKICGKYGCNSSDHLRALDYAYDNGAQIVNESFGSQNSGQLEELNKIEAVSIPSTKMRTADITNITVEGSIMRVEAVNKFQPLDGVTISGVLPEVFNVNGNVIKATNSYFTMEISQYENQTYDVLNSSGKATAPPNPNQKGLLVVAAGGNNNSNTEINFFHPANYRTSNLISVAATNRAGDLASFSNYSLSNIDVAAPGDQIWSTLPEGAFNSGNMRYGYLSGTSMAAPHVAGVAVLIQASHPHWSPNDIRKTLIATVHETDAIRLKVFSGGIINAASAVTLNSVPAATILLRQLGTGEGSIETPSMTCTTVTCRINQSHDLTFLAHASTNSTFQGWHGQCSGYENSCSLGTTSTSPIVSAKFARPSNPNISDSLLPSSPSTPAFNFDSIHHWTNLTNSKLSADGSVRVKAVWSSSDYCSYSETNTGGITIERKSGGIWHEEGKFTAPFIPIQIQVTKKQIDENGIARLKLAKMKPFFLYEEVEVDIGDEVIKGKLKIIDINKSEKIIGLRLPNAETFTELSDVINGKITYQPLRSRVAHCNLFGREMSLSDDGNTLAVLMGAHFEVDWELGSANSENDYLICGAAVYKKQDNGEWTNAILLTPENSTDCLKILSRDSNGVGYMYGARSLAMSDDGKQVYVSSVDKILKFDISDVQNIGKSVISLPNNCVINTSSWNQWYNMSTDFIGERVVIPTYCSNGVDAFVLEGTTFTAIPKMYLANAYVAKTAISEDGQLIVLSYRGWEQGVIIFEKVGLNWVQRQDLRYIPGFEGNVNCTKFSDDNLSLLCDSQFNDVGRNSQQGKVLLYRSDSTSWTGSIRQRQYWATFGSQFDWASVTTATDDIWRFDTNISGNSIGLNYDNDIIGTTFDILNSPMFQMDPAINGLPSVGATLTATSIDVDFVSLPNITFQWYRCSNVVAESTQSLPTGCEEINGATQKEFTITSASLSKYIILGVSASNELGSASKFSVSTSIIRNTAVLKSPPALSGTPAVGQTLRTSSGTWTSPTKITYSYQWQRCTSTDLSSCNNVSRANSSSYKLTSSDLNQYLRSIVSAKNAAGTVVATTALSILIGTAPSIAGVISLSGSAKQGSVISATAPVWMGSPTLSVTNQWTLCNSMVKSQVTSQPRGCTVIAGANSLSYTVQSADKGKYLVLRSTATNAYGTSTVWSKSTGKVAG